MVVVAKVKGTALTVDSDDNDRDNDNNNNDDNDNDDNDEAGGVSGGGGAGIDTLTGVGKDNNQLSGSGRNGSDNCGWRQRHQYIDSDGQRQQST